MPLLLELIAYSRPVTIKILLLRSMLGPTTVQTPPRGLKPRAPVPLGKPLALQQRRRVSGKPRAQPQEREQNSRLALKARGELCVCELVDALDISQSSLSSHLQICRQVGVLTTRKEGRWIYYSLSARYAPLIERIFSELQTIRRDEQLHRDTRRLRKRLQMREGSRCVVGSGQLRRERELADVVD